MLISCTSLKLQERTHAVPAKKATAPPGGPDHVVKFPEPEPETEVLSAGLRAYGLVESRRWHDTGLTPPAWLFFRGAVLPHCGRLTPLQRPGRPAMPQVTVSASDSDRVRVVSL